MSERVEVKGVVQLVECLPGIHRVLPQKPRMVAGACNPSTWEMEGSKMIRSLKSILVTEWFPGDTDVEEHSRHNTENGAKQ